MVLEFSRDLSVLGCPLIIPRGEQRALAHIEIKKLNAATLDANSFGGSLIQLHADERKPAYFILVTNATLTPAALFNASESFKARGCQLLLVDRLRLARLLCMLESFRPFAPMVVAEEQFTYFDLKTVSRFMLFTAPVRPQYQADLPGIKHVDGSARIQAVAHNEDPN